MRALIETAQKILNRNYSELVGDATALNWLAGIGPDAMVNSFAVNIRGNTDPALANRLMELVFQRLSYSNTRLGQEQVNKIYILSTLYRDLFWRVPLYLTMTSRDSGMGQAALDQYKARVGVRPGPEPFSFLIATCLNPWETSGRHCRNVRRLFREVSGACAGH